MSGGGTRLPAKAPGIGCDQKAIARHVQNVVIDFEGLPPGFVKLRVGQQPASLGSIPNFANNVVLEVAGIEITPEPTANSRGNSLGSQHGDKKHREVAADADQAPVNGSSDEEWTGIQRKKSTEKFFCGTNVTLAFARIRNLKAIQVACHVFMQRHTLYYSNKGIDLLGQGFQHCDVLPGGRHYARSGIVVDGFARRRRSNLLSRLRLGCHANSPSGSPAISACGPRTNELDACRHQPKRFSVG